MAAFRRPPPSLPGLLGVRTDLQATLSLASKFRFPGKIIFTTSIGLEDQVILHLIAEHAIDIDIVTLDTGRPNSSPQCGDQSPPLTCPPNIVRTEHNAVGRCNLRLVLKSVLEARSSRWVWPKVVGIETYRGTAGQKASSK